MTAFPASPSLLCEACVETLADAVAAERLGAQRLELCSALDEDGLTPSPELLRACLATLHIPVMVMIRPRAGDFVCSAAELAVMQAQIADAKAAGAAGVVFGLLTPQGDIDVVNSARLARAAAPLPVTFHKAFDALADLPAAFRVLHGIEGISRVLTSGGQATAWAGRHLLKALQEMPGRRLQIVAAGRLTPENRQQLAEFTGIREVHGKRIV